MSRVPATSDVMRRGSDGASCWQAFCDRCVCVCMYAEDHLVWSRVSNAAVFPKKIIDKESVFLFFMIMNLIYIKLLAAGKDGNKVQQFIQTKLTVREKKSSSVHLRQSEDKTLLQWFKVSLSGSEQDSLFEMDFV